MLHSSFDHIDGSLASVTSRPQFLRTLALVLVVSIVPIGCVSSAIQEGIDSAGDAAGEQVGKALGSQIVSAVDLPAPGSARYNQVMLSQAQVMFSYAFSAGGMWPAETSYEPGEWTTYRVGATGGETALDTLERAFLKRTDDGNEWWRIRGVQDGDAWVYEALLDPGRETVVRMRAKDPKGEVGEVPVTERTVYEPPQELTEESVEGATVDTESINAPAGTFTARRVEYKGMAGSTVTWFLTDDVPGSVVQYQGRREGEEWTSTLLDYGTGATTQLNSY